MIMREEAGRTYYTTFFDSARWTRFETRPDDIIITTPYKAGTTWTQNIVLHLIFQDLHVRTINEHSIWLDMRFNDFEEVSARYAAQTHRRCIKSHLPADGLPHDPRMKYIFVGRDARDIFMSLWNFYINFKDHMFDPIDDPAVADLPRPPEDILTFWDQWINRGAFEPETDGYPFWSCLRQTQTWWDVRDRENLLFLHHGDMLRDLRGEIARIAAFLEIDVSDEMLDGITDLCTFSSMRRRAETIDASSEDTLKGGAKAFINKGTNGRWRGVLTPDRLARYEEVAKRVLSPDCKAWMENGSA
jgi:aryl sulfotransferase